MAIRVSRKELAAHWGVSTQRVDALVSSGALVPDDEGRIDRDAADQVRAGMNQNNAAKEAEAKALGGQRADQQNQNHPLVKARTMQAVFKARDAELEFKKKSGEVVSTAEVAAQAYEAGRIVQSHLRAFSARLTSELAVFCGLPPAEAQVKIREALDRDVRAVIADMQTALSKLGAN
jgi:phage terminase Nu1 subunit (DNA packaging protein)